MRARTAAGIVIALAAVGCGKKDKEGLGAGADTTGLRDTATTAATTPTPAPIPDSIRERTAKILGDSTSQASAGTPKNQTQSGMKNKTGQSTLGPAVKRTRPDANEPVTAKGDILSQSPDQRATDSLNKAAMDRINGQHDTMPQQRPMDTVPPTRDSTLPAPTDSMRMPPPLPLDTIKPLRDSAVKDTTTKDSTQHH